MLDNVPGRRRRWTPMSSRRRWWLLFGRLKIRGVELDGLLGQELAAVAPPVLGKCLAGLALQLAEEVALKAAHFGRVVERFLHLNEC